MTFEFDKPKESAYNRHAHVDCDECGGDRMVEFQTRTDTYNDRSAEVTEYVPCPSCNAEANTYFRRGHDGSAFRTPDAARVRERLARR